MFTKSAERKDKLERISYIKNKRGGNVLEKIFRVKLEVDDKLLISEVKVYATSLETGIKIVDYLSAYEEASTSQLAIKQEDSILLLDKKEVIYAEIYQKELTIFTKGKQVKVKQPLSHLLSELPKEQYMQISKSGVVRLDQIQKLELSFSGNLTAVLSNGMKVQVARRYVKELKQRLRI